MNNVESILPLPSSWELVIGVMIAELKRDGSSKFVGEESFVDAGAVERPIVLWKNLGELVQPVPVTF
jgi:hypothetical protein